MAYAQLRQKRIDRASVNALSATVIFSGRGLDVIGSIGYEEGECGEPLQCLLTCFRATTTRSLLFWGRTTPAEIGNGHTRIGAQSPFVIP